MKKIKAIIWFVNLLIILCLTVSGKKAKAQSNEVVQLLLNVEKLSQLRSILDDMKSGYAILTNGYNAIKNISEGNFSLHRTFLDGLMLVNPEIKKYHRVADIISYQKSIVSEYRSALSRFRSSGNFNAGELAYLGNVYQSLTDRSVRNLDELLMVITASQLRMSDEERLKAIDRIFAKTEEMLTFLRHFNHETGILDMLRQRERYDVEALEHIYLPNN